MPPALAALLRLVAARVGDALAVAVVGALLRWATTARERIADASDTLDDEQAIEAWVQHIDDLIEGGLVLEAASDWVLHHVVLPLALRAWDELQDAAAASRAMDALEALAPPLSPAARRVLARREAGLQGTVRRLAPAGPRSPLSPRPERAVLATGEAGG